MRRASLDADGLHRLGKLQASAATCGAESALGRDGAVSPRILEIDFYRALRFTLTFALITCPSYSAWGLRSP
jgi:hypothetical protein